MARDQESDQERQSEQEPRPGEGLAYADNISIAWKPVDHPLDDTHLAMVNASNENFLRAVSVIGDGASGFGKEPLEGAGGIAAELNRLDLKLNLVLDLVGTLVYHELDIPDMTPVRVSSTGVAWAGTRVPAPGERVFLELYIQRGLPKPLCCYGDVVSSASEYEAGEARVRFLGLCGAASDWLNKLIFRHHRREVAFRRARDSGQPSNS